METAKDFAKTALIYEDIEPATLIRLIRMVNERDAAIRAEDRQLPRAMIDEFDAMRETYDTAEAIARRYGYSIKEE